MFLSFVWRASVTLFLWAIPVSIACSSLPPGAVTRFGTTQFRVTECAVFHATASTKGDVVAVRSVDGVHVFDTASGQRQRSIPVAWNGFNGSPSPAQLSPDGRMLAVVDSGFGAQQGLVLHDTASEGARGSYSIRPFKRWHAGIAFSADGKRLAVSGENDDEEPVVRVWNLTTDQMIQEWIPSDQMIQQLGWTQFVQLALSVDGGLLVAWGPDQVETYDVGSGKQHLSLRLEKGHTVAALALAPDGKQLAVADQDPLGSTITLYEPVSGKRLASYPLADPIIAPLRYTPDSKKLLAPKENGDLQIWEAATGKGRKLRQLAGWKFEDVIFKPNGRMIGVSSCGQAVCLWDIDKEQPLTPQFGHTVPVRQLAFSRDSGTLFSTAVDGVHEWDVAAGKHRRFWLRKKNVTYDDTLFELSPDASRLLRRVEGDTGGRQVVDRASDTVVATLPRIGGSPIFSTDGRLAVFHEVEGTPRQSSSHLEVWDLNAGRQVFKQEGQSWENIVQALSGDGRLLATASFEYQLNSPNIKPATVRVWRLKDAKNICEFTVNNPCLELAFSPDGTWLAMAGRTGRVEVWDTRYDERRLSWNMPEGCEASHLTFSADGRMLAAVVEGDYLHENDIIRVWEMATAAVRSEFVGFGPRVTALAFSPDSRRLASAHQDTSILLWDTFGSAEDHGVAPTGPQPQSLAKLWNQLEDHDPQSARKAMRQLASTPAETVGLMRKHLFAATVEHPAPSEVKQLLADLDDEDFKRREAASGQLEKMGRLVQPALEETRKTSTSVEQKRRVESLLELLKNPFPPPQLLRPLRAVEVLEHLATSEAKALLQELAKGDAEARLTQEAQAALKRLAARE